MLPPLPITVEEARERQGSGGRVVFLDARTPDSWDRAESGIAGALRLPPAEVENHLRWVPRCPVVTYAAAEEDFSAIRAAAALIHNGWKDVHPLAGGFDAWTRAGLPTQPKDLLNSPAR